jgi:hypothetical protein
VYILGETWYDFDAATLMTRKEAVLKYWLAYTTRRIA